MSKPIINSTFETEPIKEKEEFINIPEFEDEKKEIYKNLHNINTFQCVDNELYLRGNDEDGNDFTICFDTFDFLEWIDKEKMNYIKEQLTKYINKK
jgi:hypothetical protein